MTRRIDIDTMILTPIRHQFDDLIDSHFLLIIITIIHIQFIYK